MPNLRILILSGWPNKINLVRRLLDGAHLLGHHEELLLLLATTGIIGLSLVKRLADRRTDLLSEFDLQLGELLLDHGRIRFSMLKTRVFEYSSI